MKRYLFYLTIAIALAGCGIKPQQADEVPEGGYQRLVVTSSTHIGFLYALGAEDRIVGICDPQYCYHAIAGAQDMGSSLQIDAERILAAGADAVLLSNYGTNEHVQTALRQLGITPIVIDEWKEETPLGRASWIRKIGALVDKQVEADSIYAMVEQQYRTIKEEAASVASGRQTILTGGSWQGTWYVPGGRTYMAELFRDAGADYAYQNDTTRASLPLSFEQILLTFRDADIWVGAPASSLAELQAMDAKHEWFKAYQTGRVYNFNKRTTPSGANDFWETGVVHPEWILSDLVGILRNQPDSTLYFATNLK